MHTIDYDSFSRLYDLYASTDYDFEFFVNEIEYSGTKVLELTSGTGRLSVPLIEAGADLTCVDISQGMLHGLNQKLWERNYSASVICPDVTEIKFESEFDLAVLPFQSFMELIGSKKQTEALSAIYRGLKPSGRFICTMHNPSIRRKMVDGSLRLVAEYTLDSGMLVVSGIEQGGHPVVARSQFY
jgi:ubiquinone/menaquinone biosynthesis C-methylase UbiE